MRRNRLLPLGVLLSSQFIYGAELLANEITIDWWSLIQFIIESLGPFLIVQLPLITILLSILLWSIYMRVFKINLPTIETINLIDTWAKRSSFFCNLVGVIGTFTGFIVLIKYMAEYGGNGNNVPWLAGAMALSTTIIGLIGIGISYEPILWFGNIRQILVEDNKNV